MLSAQDIHPLLRIAAEGVIGQGCSSIVLHKMLPSSNEVDPLANRTPRLVELLRFSASSEGPAVDPDTEVSFEKNASWGSPAPRVEAAQALFDLVLHRPDLYEFLRADAQTLLKDHHPAVRLQATLSLGKIWDISRDDFWLFLTQRIDLEKNLSVLEHVINGVVSRILHQEPQRTLALIQSLIAREELDSARLKRMYVAVSKQLTILWVRYDLNGAHETLQTWIAQPASFAAELKQVMFTLRGVIVVGLADRNEREAANRGRALTLLANIVDAANLELAAHYVRSSPSETQQANANDAAHLVDAACQQLLFSIGSNQASNMSELELDHVGLAQFLGETAPIMERIGEYATPHTIYNLLQLLERLIPVDPGRVFDLTAHALRGGTRSGYQHESMGIDLLVKLVGTFLADHKEIFEVADRQEKLIDCLEIFMEAGWPAARRLLYRLPELMQ